MTDQNTPTAADKLKQALAAKKAKGGHGSVSYTHLTLPTIYSV